jgi:hypothetical protein
MQRRKSSSISSALCSDEKGKHSTEKSDSFSLRRKKLLLFFPSKETKIYCENL